jgi:cold shock CspA family protein
MTAESGNDGARPAMDKALKKGLVPGQATGKVKSYSPGRNPFGGFITDDRTQMDVFVHKSAVQGSGLQGLQIGQKVAFAIVEDGFGGFKAANLSVLEG